MSIDPQADTVDQLVLDHLDHSDLPETAKDLVIAALLGGEELSSVLGGAAPRRPAPPSPDTETPEPIGTYLASIEVTGFRGIGPTATLNLVPGPGLTIVTGRNGSGKSSFAEAAEFALILLRRFVTFDGFESFAVVGGFRLSLPAAAPG